MIGWRMESVNNRTAERRRGGRRSLQIHKLRHKGEMDEKEIGGRGDEKRRRLWV